MFIITKKYLDNNDIPDTTTKTDINSTIHIIFGKNIVDANKWIRDYISIDIDSLKYKPNEKYINKVEYNIVQDKTKNNESRVFYLQKTYTKLVKGYIYNSYVTNVENIYSIKLTYVHDNTKNDTQNNNYCDQWVRDILTNLDKESLLNVFFNFYNELEKKNIWTKNEFLNLQKNILEKYDIKTLKYKIE